MPKKGKNLTVEVRRLIVESVMTGERQNSVVEKFHITPAAVSKQMKKFRAHQGLEDKTRCRRPRKTSQRIDHVIKRKSVSDPKKNATQICREIRDEYSVEISYKTVSRRRNAAGLHARISVKKPWINSKNRKKRVEFAKSNLHWTSRDWDKVLCSDESKFCMFGSDGIRYIRRPVDHRNNPRYIRGQSNTEGEM